MSKMLFWGIVLTFMQSCDKATNDNGSNPFVGTWVASGTYENTPADYYSPHWLMSGTYNYSITITEDQRCHVVGNHNVTVAYYTGSNTHPHNEERSDDYYLSYDLDGNNCIMTKGRSPKDEDGFYLDGSLCLLKNDNTLSGDAYFQSQTHDGRKVYIKRELDFKRQ
jgi:hypothetical protein